MIRSRLQEHCERILRDDLLTLFGCTASLRSIECSILLEGTSQMSEEVKYRAACVMEILTGQRPTLQSCRLEEENPQFVKKSGEEQKAMERLKSAMMHRSNSSATAADFRALGNGTVLRSTLRRYAMYDFLEKMREFYLPDVLLHKAGNDPLTMSLSSSVLDDGKNLAAYFAAWNKSHLPENSRFVPAKPTDLTLTTALVLRASELLKFPDIEAHFEALGNTFASSPSNSDDGLKLILRPTLTIKHPLGIKSSTLMSGNPVNNFGVFNYLLCKLFNPYITRPKLSLIKA